MSTRHLIRTSRLAFGLAVLLSAAVLLAAVAVSCGGGGDNGTATTTPAKTGTATAAKTATPAKTATSAVTATPSKTGTPGVTASASATASPATATASPATATASPPTGTPTPEGAVCGPAARAATIKDPTAGITDTEIRLGADSILSGASGAVYATLGNATAAYFKYVNATQGGVCGRKINFTIEDNQEDPARSLEAVRRLVEQDHVFAMVGSLGDAAHPGSWEYLNQNGVPDLLVSAGSARFGADPCGHPWEVQMIPSYGIDAGFLAQNITEDHPGEDVAVLWENDDIGKDGLAGLRQGLAGSSNNIVADASYDNTSISVTSQVANLAKGNPGVFVIEGNLGFIALAAKAADRLGWKPAMLWPYIGNDQMLFQFVGNPKIVEGAITTNANKQATMTDDPAVADFIKLQHDYGGPSPSNFTLYGQILGELAVDIFNRSCDNLTREGVMETVESTKNWHSPLLLDGVTFSFSPTDHVGYQSSIFMKAYINDKGLGYWDYYGPLRQFEGIQ